MSAKVSIIMAVYNAEGYVNECIDSILEQTYTDWKMIICDDGSTDNTFCILKKYKESYPDKFVIIQNEKNSKLPFSLNHCLKYADGEYIARMDADDKSHPDRLKKQVEYLDNHPETDLVGTAMYCFDGTEQTGIHYPPQNPDRSIIGLGVPFFHATIMTRSNVYKELGGYSLNPHVLRCEDVELWMRFFAANYVGDNIQVPLYYVREDQNAVRRRQFKYSLNASRTLLTGYMKYNYPIWQYIYILKPIVSGLTPKKIKYLFNKGRWRN